MLDSPEPQASGKVLLIDDDRELCALLKEYLAGHGLLLTTSHDGLDGVDKALSGQFSVVVLDLMLPALDGLDVLRRVRAASAVPVLVLTARGEESDRVVGLELGADDYLVKPGSPRELLARIRALLRRNPAHWPPRPQVVRLDDLEVDRGARRVLAAGTPVALTSAEFDLLVCLMHRPGVILSRDALAERVLGRRLAVDDRSIDVHVSRLRRKLGTHPHGVERIKAVRGAGYLYTVTDAH